MIKVKYRGYIFEKGAKMLDFAVIYLMDYSYGLTFS